MDGAMTWFAAQSPILQSLLAGLFTWTVTACGAAVVFVTSTVNRRLLDAMMGFAAGVMIAASFWSLLAPSIDMAEAQGCAKDQAVAQAHLAQGAFVAVGRFMRPQQQHNVAVARGHMAQPFVFWGGLRLRLVPAIPTAREPGNFAS